MIVAISLLLYVLITLFITNHFKWHYVAAAGLVALISWLDDLYSLSSVFRLLVHAAAALIVICGLGFLTDVHLPGFGWNLHVGSVGSAFAFLWIVWMINAYNFMDGIDGIAGSQAVLAGFSWLIFGYLFGYQSMYFFGGVLAFSSLGFLMHNWSPAKVFMGDVGSAFLGFTFAVLPLIALNEKPADSYFLFFPAILFLWFFLFDTVYTLVRRALRGEKVWNPHREHLYQRMTIAGWTHSAVTIIYSGFTAIVAVTFLIGAFFRGSWELLSLFMAIVLSAALFLFTVRKKRLT